MKLLGLDYGTRRIGLALGDTETKLAVPYETIELSGMTLECLTEIISREGIETIVVGLPKTLKGEEGQVSVLVREFIKELKSLGLKIVLEDERLTTKEVERAMRGYGRAKRGVDKDAAAAALILQSYLDRL